MFKHTRAKGDRFAGFTIVELMLTIVIIGILMGLSTTIIVSHRSAGRDAERESDVESIARSFELSYLRDATSAGPSYPTTQRAANITGYPALFKKQDLSATKAPGTTEDTSIVASTSTSRPQSPSKNQYIYLPLTSSGSLCEGSDICVRFFIYYRLEGNNSVRTVESMHQQ